MAALALVLAALELGSSSAAPRRTVPTATARISRTNVIERQQAAGTLGFRGSFTVFNVTAGGVVTWLPSPGDVVRRGEKLYELNRRPVTLFYGQRPAFREFAAGMSDGGDVLELKRNLLALGFTDGGGLSLNNHFDHTTKVAVEQWQRSLGRSETGRVRLGTVEFLPGAVRVAGTNVSVGSLVQPGAPVLTATSTRQVVLVSVDPGTVAQLRAGDRVVVTMPGGALVPGRVSSVGRVATVVPGSSQGGGQDASTPTVPVTVTLPRRHASLGLDQAPVQVAITTEEARHVLAVPVAALLARPGGGYATQIASGASRRLVPVLTGLFDEISGRVEVSGRGIAAGMRVVVPAG